MTDGWTTRSIAAAETHSSADAEHYADAVRASAAAGRKIVDYGRYCADLGHPPPPEHVRISPPAGILKHYVSDLTVSAAGGTPLAQLQEALAEHGQWLPIDGMPATATLAEIVAHNLYGPLRLGYGGVRELLLGLRIVDGRGRLLHVGGRTVKNVAGYDVTRLMVGNLNTLGLIAEATFRTVSRPDRVTAVGIRGIPPWDLDPHVTGLLSGDTAPAYLWGESAFGPGGSADHRLHVGYVGSEIGRDVQADALQQWLAHHLGPVETARTDGTYEADQQQRQAAWTWQMRTPAWIKLIVPPAHTGRIVQKLTRWIDGPIRVQTLPAWGIVHIGVDLDARTARAVDRRLVEAIEAAGGLRIWMRQPADAAAAAERLDPIGPAQPEGPILKRLKAVFDPDDVLNPGRFLN